MRALIVGVLALAAALSVWASVALSSWWWIPAVLLIAGAALAGYDVTQRRHSVLRNYPVLGHLRFLLERRGPSCSSTSSSATTTAGRTTATPAPSIYERAKGIHGRAGRSAPSATSTRPATSTCVHSTAPGRPAGRAAAGARSAARTAPSPTTWRCSTSRR